MTARQRQVRSMERRILFFWPVVELPEDFERVTLLGYWVCFALAAGNLIWSVYTLRSDPADAEGLGWLRFALPLVTVTFYFLAANALRRASWPVAATVEIVLVVDAITQRVLSGSFAPINTAECVLFAIVAWGIWLASHRTVAAVEPLTVYNHAWPRDLLIGRLPPLLWPRMQWLFWLTAAALLALFLAPILLPQRF